MNWLLCEIMSFLSVTGNTWERMDEICQSGFTFLLTASGYDLLQAGDWTEWVSSPEIQNLYWEWVNLSEMCEFGCCGCFFPVSTEAEYTCGGVSLFKSS